jgi:hypothetical protein
VIKQYLLVKLVNQVPSALSICSNFYSGQQWGMQGMKMITQRKKPKHFHVWAF